MSRRDTGGKPAGVREFIPGCGIDSRSRTHATPILASRAATGAVGFDAGGEWYRRLKEARDAGFSTWEAAQLWIGEPEDLTAGTVPDDAEELVLANSRAARRLAGHADGYERRG